MGLEDMGPSLLLKKVSKETLLGDVQYRGAISDFTVVKKQITKADYSELWIRYNEDDVYGDGNNFELACTKAAGDQFELEEAEMQVAAEAAATAAAELAEQNKPGRRKKVKPESKPWVSLGSETEIEHENVVTDKTPKVVLQVLRKRIHFNSNEKVKKLGDVDAITLWNSASMECRPFKEKIPSINFSETDVGVQAVPFVSEIGTQATPGVPKPMATQYEPRRTVAETDNESASTAEVSSSQQKEKLTSFLDKVNPLMRSALQQNECYDIFVDDFSQLADDDTGSGGRITTTAMEEMHSFTSLKYNKGKTVACVDWAPSGFFGPGVVAASCVETTSFEHAVATGGVPRPGAVLIWDFEDPIHPKYVLEAPSDVQCFEFNKDTPTLVAGGLANGQVCFWDVSDLVKDTKSDKGTTPVCHPKFVSEVPESHVSPVTDVTWLGADISVTKPRGELLKPNPVTGNCTFFATTSADGKVLFWDTEVKKDTKRRNFFLNPSYKIMLGRGEQSGTLQAVKFDFSPSLRPPARDGSLPENATSFFASSADGEVAQCDFIAGEEEGGVSLEFTKMCSTAHSNAVRSISRSPFFPDLVVTAGAASFKLWRFGSQHPVFSSPQLPTKFNSCAFSPTRPSVVFVAKDDGVVDAWDLLDRSHEPSVATRVNSTAVGPIKFVDARNETAIKKGKHREQLLAVGDAGGVLHVVRTPRALRKPKLRELERMEAFLHRESARAVDAVERAEAREAAIATREEANAAAAAVAGGKAEKPSARRGARGDRELTDDERREQEYLVLEERFMIEMGLKDPPVEKEE